MSFLPFSTNQRNNESAKMIRARMVRSRKSISYSNSTSLHIHQDIRSKDIQINKRLLMYLGIMRFFTHWFLLQLYCIS